MIVGAACLSHTPLLDRASAPAEAKASFCAAVDRVAARAAHAEPQLAIVFYPDHFNGLFYDLMPCFGIAANAYSIGDFGTVPGGLAVAEHEAMECVAACLSSGIDVAFSYRMQVDHGCVQPLELLARQCVIPAIIPAFMNCVAPPLPSFGRAAAFGAAVGRWAAGLPQRVLLIASGGLSHDPPIPTMADATSAQRAALIDNRNPTHSSRLARQRRVFDTQIGEVKDGRPTRPINADWDRALLHKFAKGDLEFFGGWVDSRVTAEAGGGAHEVRTWAAALSALKAGAGEYHATVEFYEPVDAWLTGTAVLFAQPKSGETHEI